ncbi:MAG: hypothetical protein ABFC89_07175 [Methanospirillum sp.]
MQRRYALLAAVALVAVALLPGAALAAGFQNGFGPKASPLGEKQGAPDWAGNATALRANQSAGAGDGVCDGACLTNQNRDQDRTQLRDRTCQTNQVCSGDQDRTQLRTQTRLNQTASSDSGKQYALQGRHQRGASS